MMKKIFIIFLLSLFLNFSLFSQCDSITTFPWTEGFENYQDSVPDCWYQDILNSGWDRIPWNIVSNDQSLGIPTTSHNGVKKLFISLDCGHDSMHQQDLALPPFDISGLTNPTLTFWHANNSRGMISLNYKSSKDQELWQSLHGYYYYIAENWTQVSIPLPNKSNYYQIAIIGHHSGGGYGEIQIDDISITDGPISNIENQTPTFHIAPNPVQDNLMISGINISSININDMYGKLIFSYQGTLNSINMSIYPKGLYFVTILSTDGDSFTKKIVKQ